MPEWIAMLVCFGLLFVIGGFVLFLHILDMIRSGTNKAMWAGALVYLVERLKK